MIKGFVGTNAKITHVYMMLNSIHTILNPEPHEAKSQNAEF